MKKIDLGQAITILANVGVIAGIAFLGIELRQNNELMASQQRFNRLAISTGSATIVSESPSLASALAKRVGELTPGEMNQVSNWYRRVFGNIEWTLRELPRDELPIESWRALQEAFEADAHYFWERSKLSFDPEFARFMDEEVWSANTRE